jgi:hypothetical protein
MTWRGLCELNVLGAINFLAVVLFNVSSQESRLAHSVRPENCVVQAKVYLTCMSEYGNFRAGYFYTVSIKG